MDPVDQVSISNYAAFRNNPIVFVDILGDVATTSYSYKGKGIGKEERIAKYIDNKWVDSETGSPIDFDRLKGKKSKQIMNAYSNMHDITDLNELTSFVDNLIDDVDISLGNKSEFLAQHYLETGELKITINPSEVANSGAYQNNDSRNNSTILLTHEMGHLYDMCYNGAVNMRKVESIKDENGEIVRGSKSELHAMYFENIARNYYGFGMRIKYHPKLTSTNVKVLYDKQKKTFSMQHPQFNNFNTFNDNHTKKKKKNKK